jgi:hypothetical protein
MKIEALIGISGIVLFFAIFLLRVVFFLENSTTTKLFIASISLIIVAGIIHSIPRKSKQKN